MDNLSNIGVIKELLARHGFTFSKSLGQNFLINPSVCPRIAREGGAGGGYVLEIGTGIGVLTTELARIAKKVVAIELDKRLFPILDETLSGFSNVKIIQGDILNAPLYDIIKTEFGNEKVAVCANLPYYITSPVIIRLLEHGSIFSSITVMVQKEAADRICAKPGSRECGAITMACNYYAEAKKLFSVSKGSFLPAPKVDSAVIRLDLREKPAVEVEDEKEFFALIRAGFSQRRKMLPTPLSAHLKISKDDCRKLMESIDIPPTYRAEQLTLEQFARLSDAVSEMK